MPRMFHPRDKGERMKYDIDQEEQYDGMRSDLEREEYTQFIKQALNCGFTDEQADFMWQEIKERE